eukprot:SAG31_NODE_12517_length_935_cov_4.087321_1_plen_60_part_00
MSKLRYLYSCRCWSSSYLPPEVALALLLPLVPAATAPLAPTTLLPAQDGVLASSVARYV